jgi:hypothetical protein
LLLIVILQLIDFFSWQYFLKLEGGRFFKVVSKFKNSFLLPADFMNISLKATYVCLYFH